MHTEKEQRMSCYGLIYCHHFACLVAVVPYSDLFKLYQMCGCLVVSGQETEESTEVLNEVLCQQCCVKQHIPEALH